MKIHGVSDAGFMLLALILAAPADSPAGSVPGGGYGDLISHGREALGEGNLDVARQAFEAACPAGLPRPAMAEAALCEHELGALAHTGDRVADAESHYLAALKLWETAGPQFAAQHATTLTNLAALYQAEHRNAEAAAALKSAIAIAGALEPKNPLLYGSVLSRLAEAESESNPEEARRMLMNAIDSLRESPGNASRLAYAYNALGMLALRSGGYEEAEGWLRRTLAMAQDTAGVNAIEIAAYETNLGLALFFRAEYPEAAKLLRRAIGAFEAHPGYDVLHLATALAELGAAESATGKFGLAEEDSLRACSLLERQHGPESMEALSARVNLGLIYLNAKKTTDAERVLMDAVSAERRTIPHSRALANGVRALARLRGRQRRWPESEALYAESISIYQETVPPNHPELQRVRREYDAVLRHKIPRNAVPA